MQPSTGQAYPAATPLPLALVATASIIALWSFSFWAGWQVVGLNSDGAYFFAQILSRGRPTSFGDHSRLYVIGLTQGPLVAAMALGVTDIKLLARIYSWTTLALPALLYSLAIVRARKDPDLLALVVGTVAVVFLPSSLFSVGEYNTIHAAVIMAGTWLVTSRGPSLRDMSVLLLLGTLCLRSYESSLFLGPLVASLTILRWPRLPASALGKPGTIIAIMVLPLLVAFVATSARYALPLVVILAIAGLALAHLHRPALLPIDSAVPTIAVAALFLAGSIVALTSFRLEAGSAIARSTLSESIADTLTHMNPQLFLALALAAISMAASVLRSGLLIASALLLIVALASMPAWYPADPPVAFMHYPARLPCGLLTMAFLVMLMLQPKVRQTGAWGPGLALAMVLSMMPSSFHAATEWGDALAVLRRELNGKPGTVTFADLPPGIQRWYRHDPLDASYLPVLSRLVNARESDGHVTDLRPLLPLVVERDQAPYVFPVSDRYRWRD